MNFSIPTLLAQFSDGKGVAPKQLEKKLGCEEGLDQQKLQIVLDALEKTGLLIKERGRYRRSESEDLVEARLRCSSKGFCFAIRDSEESEDIYVREALLNHAWHGDRVLVKVTKEGSRRRSPEGEVKVILERATASVLARIRQDETRFKAVPLDDRLLFELQLPADAPLADAVDHLASVEVSRYPIAQLPPTGQVTQILGSSAEEADDLDIVCCKHDLRRVYPEAAIAGLPTLPKSLRKGDFENTVDLRKLATVAIVPDHSTLPVDTAFSVVRTADGGYQLAVHTVDVASWVPFEGTTDQEAQRRGATVRLGATAVDLLPSELGSKLGSFSAGEARRAVSLLINLDAQGRVLDYELQPTAVQVDTVLPESVVQHFWATGTTSKEDGIGRSKELLEQLRQLAVATRTQRLEQQGFEIQLREPEHPDLDLNGTRIPYGDEGQLGAMTTPGARLCRALLRELLVLANQLVGRHLAALGLPALYRIQRAPDSNSLQELTKLAAGLDLELPPVPEVLDHRYLRSLSDIFATSPLAQVLNYLLLDQLRPASYSTQPGAHFSLGLPKEQPYVRFVSPSRRYGDFWTQRLLLALFSEGRDRRTSRSKDGVNLRHSSCQGQISWQVLPNETQSSLETAASWLAPHLSEREKLAQEAENDFVGLQKAKYMKAHTGDIFEGLITGVQSYGFFVEIEDLLVEGLVHVSSLKDDWYEYRSRQQRLIGRKSRRQFALGDRVRVQVRNVDYYRQQIDLTIVTDEESESTLDPLDPSQAIDE